MSIEQFPIAEKASSNIKWARYDSAAAKLQIDFKNTAGEYQSTYEYDKFTRQDWEDFRAASRPGEHFAYRIRGKYAYRKIVKPTAPAEPEPEQGKLF